MRISNNEEPHIRVEHRQWVLQERVIRILGHKRDKGTVGQREVETEEFHQILLADKAMENNMGGPCSTHGADEKFVQNCREHTREDTTSTLIRN
jgi:hypothetical protein